MDAGFTQERLNVLKYETTGRIECEKEVNSGLLDLEELKSVHYGISIINDPVIMGKEPPGAILLRSKFGQQYQCSYPDRQTEDEKAKQEQQEAIDIGIPDLLKPMGQQACLIFPKDWWTYEFCYGKYVKQYHMEGGQVVGNLIYLGYFESEFDWNNVTEQEKKRKYHSQTYTNGTVCDLTSKQRQVEVRFECEEGSLDYVHEISEAETCVYTLTVRTPRVCKHPYLQKPAPAVPIPITCNPLVTAEQYQHHIDTIEGQKRMTRESTRLKARKLLERQGEKKEDYTKIIKINEDESPSHTMEVDSEGRDSIESTVSNINPQTEGELREVQEEPTVERLLRDTFGLNNRESGNKNTKNHPMVNDKKMKVKVFKDHSELRDYLKKMVNQGKPKTEEVKDKDVEGMEETGELEAGEENIEEETDGEDTLTDVDQDETSADQKIKDEDEKLLEEFSKELSDIVDTEEKRVHIAQYKETLKSAMQAKFSDIIDEAELELGDELDDPVNKDAAFNALATTLNKLIKKVALTKLLKKAQKEKENMEQQIQLAKQRMKEKQNQDEDTSANGEHVSEPETEEASKDLSNTEVNPLAETRRETSDTAADKGHIDTLQSQREESQITDKKPTVEKTENLENIEITESKNVPESTQVSGDEQKAGTDDVPSIENRVRVRVTRIKHATPSGGSRPPSRVLEGTGEQDKKTLELPEEQRKQLETTVKTELEKAGLETQGQKIEVKIITAGYFDTNKEGVHVLSEEESSAFNNMIVSILGGNNQAAQEMARQRQMEESYSYVWGQETKKVKATDASAQTPSTPTQEPDTQNTTPEAPTEPQIPPE